jgi:hypothetical protein
MLMTIGFAAETHGDTVGVRKTIMPFVAQSTFIATWDFSFWSCFPAICYSATFLETGPPSPVPDGSAAVADGEIRVGFAYSYDAGTKPCNCWAYLANAYRGTVLFRTGDIPHHFKTATLVLTAKTVNSSDPGFKNPFSIFRQDSVPYPLAIGYIRFDPATGRTTAMLRHLGQFSPAALDTDLGPPFTPSKIEESADFSFRIDVSSVANSWVQDWPNRNLTPLHGFTLVGFDESLPTESNVALQFTYAGTLEFDIDDPDF